MPVALDLVLEQIDRARRDVEYMKKNDGFLPRYVTGYTKRLIENNGLNGLIVLLLGMVGDGYKPNVDVFYNSYNAGFNWRKSYFYTYCVDNKYSKSPYIDMANGELKITNDHVLNIFNYLINNGEIVL